MLRILRSVSVLEKIAFTVILSRKYRIPVYILRSQNKQEFSPIITLCLRVVCLL